MDTLSRALKVMGLLSMAVILLLLMSCSSNNDVEPEIPSHELWLADVEFYQEQMPLRHVNLYHGVDEPTFNAAIEELKTNLPDLTYNQFVLELMRITALASSEGRDGHTGLNPFQPTLNYHMIPIEVFSFEDGLYVVNAVNPEIIGSKLVNIGEHKVEDIILEMSKFLSKDNDYSLRFNYQVGIAIAELLEAAGYVENAERIEITVETESGSLASYELDVISTNEYFQTFPEIQRLMLPEQSAPLYLSNQSELFWYSFETDSKTLYFQYNAVQASNNAGTSLTDIGTEIENFISNNQVDRLVVDTRLNEGGDNTTYGPLVDMIKASTLNAPNSLYVIVGRGTYSAGINFVSELEEGTDAIFVGEPTGGAPNHYGDGVEMILPNTGISVSVSSRYHMSSIANDLRLAIEPDIPAALTSQDYFNGIDPAWEAILNDN